MICTPHAESGAGQPDLKGAAMILATVGHSNRTLDQFLDMLAGHAVGAVADVRRFPASRKWPHFNGGPLEVSLAGAGVGHRHFPRLGGRRAPRAGSPHVAWRGPGFRGFADHMDGEEFTSGLDELLAWAMRGPALVALMCAEAVPWRCHRSLIADGLVARGYEVWHLLGSGPRRPHRLPDFARVEGHRVIYDRHAPVSALFDAGSL